MTLNGVIAVIALFYRIRQFWGLITLKWSKIDPYMYILQSKCSPRIQFLTVYDSDILRGVWEQIC